MNGRIYDPGIGRFLSADPFIQAPMVTQNFNRYSYVLNNPLSLSDPTGFNIFGNFFNWLNSTIGPTGTQIVVAVAAIAIGCVTAGAATAIVGTLYGATLSGIGAAIVGGAGFGFGAGFSSTIMTGGSLGQAFQAGAIGALIGGISGGVGFGLGSLPGAGEMFSLGHLGQSVGHAAIGGVTSEIQGGDWEAGALAGGLSAAFAPAINGIGGGSMDIESKAARVAASAAIGGTAAELGGGKFANGAVTAAFLRLYNEELHLRQFRASIDGIRGFANYMEVRFSDTPVGYGKNSPIYRGQLSWYTADGELVASFDIVSGGGRDATSNVPIGGNTRIPSGHWKAGFHWNNSGGTAFTLHNYTFKYALTAQFKPRPYVDAILFHPDGPPMGTAGCVGFCGSQYQLQTFNSMMQSYLKWHRSIDVYVK